MGETSVFVLDRVHIHRLLSCLKGRSTTGLLDIITLMRMNGRLRKMLGGWTLMNMAEQPLKGLSFIYIQIIQTMRGFTDLDGFFFYEKDR